MTTDAELRGNNLKLEAPNQPARSGVYRLSNCMENNCHRTLQNYKFFLECRPNTLYVYHVPQPVPIFIKLLRIALKSASLGLKKLSVRS